MTIQEESNRFRISTFCIGLAALLQKTYEENKDSFSVWEEVATKAFDWANKNVYEWENSELIEAITFDAEE